MYEVEVDGRRAGPDHRARVMVGGLARKQLRYGILWEWHPDIKLNGYGDGN